MKPFASNITLACCISLASLLALAVSCGNGDRVDSVFVEPVSADCALDRCSGQGACVEATSPDDATCMCDDGYTGARCEHCAPAFHRDARHHCAPDRFCAEQPTDPCGAHGHCIDDTGVLACACGVGYEGPRCELCADGYALAEDGSDECKNPLSGGIRVLPDPCAKEQCSGRGACHETGSMAQCSCEPGYRGAHCEQCASGYAQTTDGKKRCVPALVGAKCPSTDCTRCTKFAGDAGFPTLANTCFSASGLKLDQMTVASAKTGGTTWLCAASQHDGFAQPHIAIETGTTEATLTFSAPVSAISFGCSGWDALDLEIVGDDLFAQSVTSAAHDKRQIALAFDEPIQVLRFRSHDGRSHTFALGDIVYDLTMCK